MTMQSIILLVVFLLVLLLLSYPLGAYFAKVADHQPIRTGPYAFLRHPIYFAMFGMVLGPGLMLAQWPAIIAGVILHIAGTEIRIRSEETLLRSRFGEEFDTWARHTWAYIPFIR